MGDESYQVSIQESFARYNVIEVIDLDTNDSLDDEELKQKLIEFAFNYINP